MKILVVGNGGREHAIAWALAKSPLVTQVYVAPGNGGTQVDKKCQNLAIEVMDFASLANFALENHIRFTVVGPEAPLAGGIVDYFTARELPCFGPTQMQAQLESSKAYSKAFMVRHHIPTAKSATFTDFIQAKDYVMKQGAPIVIKADGLAAGKGVVVAKTLDEAIEALELFLNKQKLGDAGSKVVVEDFLEGEEVSFMVMVDGKNVLALATSQDHKALLNGDQGPNTGGMGAYSPASRVTPELHTRIMNEIIQPTIQGLLADGQSYRGFLYAGLMIDARGNPSVLEYNCRLGDPETQVLLFRLRSDLAELCQAALNGTLDKSAPIEWDDRIALGVVLCAGGYPEQVQKGDTIHLPELTENANEKVFHAGTLMRGNTLVTNGGRVLCVTALGKHASSAQAIAYAMAKTISWKDMIFRTDIGYREIAREQRTKACQI